MSLRGPSMGEKGSTPNTGDRAAVISNKSQSRRRLSLATIRDYWPWAAVLVLSIPLWYMFFKTLIHTVHHSPDDRLQKEPSWSSSARVSKSSVDKPRSGSKKRNLFDSLKGPHITANFPDPCVIVHDGKTYAFATNNRKAGIQNIHVQIAISNDNKTWELRSDLDALPTVAPWQTGTAVWAPDVKQRPNGQFLLYYTDSLKTDPETHCIGAAISDSVTGPYVPYLNPMICPDGGAIDPAGFYDRSTGKRYIIYKIDSNSLGHGGLCRNDVLPIVPTPLILQEVNPDDGVTLIGPPTQIFDRDALDGPLIEAPAMFLTTEGVYFLFFSSHCFTTPLYHTVYATATNITGPYTRAARPLLITGDGDEHGLGIVGPGGLDILHHSYATSDEEDTYDDSSSDEYEARSTTEEEGRLVVFHGHITPYNIPRDGPRQKPVQDLHLPFVRGMYSGIIRFRGRSATLGLDGFGKNEDEYKSEHGNEL